MDLIHEIEKEIDSYEDRKIYYEKLFPEEFMQKYTDYSSIEDMLTESGFDIESQGDFKNIPDDEWDDYVDSCTGFNNWKEMYEEAFLDWFRKDMESLHG